MKIIYILLEIIVFVIGYVSFNSEQHCDCEELSENECNKATYWCEWSNKTCVSHTQDCEHQTSFDGCFGNGAKCQFNNNTCESYECSQFNSSSDCAIRSGCYWKNNTCSENFTKCEDYEVDSCPDFSFEYGVILCKKRDGKCLDFNFLNINCSNETLCEEDYTKPDKYHKCQFIEGKCYKVPNKDPCTMFSSSKSLCEYNLDCVYDKNKCRYVECSDLQDQQSCEKYDLTKVDIKILCEWKDDKCQNLTELNVTEGYCFDQSLFNYRFYDDKCQQCKKLVPNTPIYNFTNGTNTNGTDTNGTDTNGTDTNGTINNYTYAVTMFYNYRCSCNQLYDSDCDMFSKYCTWDPKYRKCSSYNSSCSSRKSKISCEFAKCVWKNSICEKFTKCSDYDEYDCPIHKDCLKKYNGCSDFTSCSDFEFNYCPIQYGCKSFQYSTCVKEDPCTTYSKEDCQNKFEKKNYPCYVDNEGQCKSKFTILKYNICDDFHDSEQMCQKLTGCVYQDKQCIKGKCYQFTKDQCFYERSLGKQYLCKWDNIESKCGYAEFSKLNQSECTYPTLIYKYDDCKTCEKLVPQHDINY